MLVLVRALFLTFETAYMAHGGSMWSLRGPQSQDDKPDNRHSSWRFKRDKTQRQWLEPSSRRQTPPSPSRDTTHIVSPPTFWSSCGKPDTCWGCCRFGSSHEPLPEMQESVTMGMRMCVFCSAAGLDPMVSASVTYTASSWLKYFLTALFSF